MHKHNCDLVRFSSLTSSRCTCQRAPVKTKIYTRVAAQTGVYTITNGKVRYRAAPKGSHWINSVFSEPEVIAMCGEPILVNNFKERFHA